MVRQAPATARIPTACSRCKKLPKARREHHRKGIAHLAVRVLRSAKQSAYLYTYTGCHSPELGLQWRELPLGDLP